MHTLRWMRFGSSEWHAVFVDNTKVIEHLMGMLTEDDEIRKLQLIAPDTKIVMDKEWVQNGRYKHVK